MSNSLRIQRGTLNKHLKWLMKRNFIKNIGKETYCFIYAIKNKDKAIKFLENPSNFIGYKKVNEYGLTQLRVIKFLYKNPSKLKGIRNLLGNSKSSILKILRSLINKDYIHKKNKIYFLTKKGRILLDLDENIIRFVLYSNIKNLEDVKNIDLNRVGLV